MSIKSSLTINAVAIIAVLLMAFKASAVPITAYEGSLTPGVTDFGAVMDPSTTGSPTLAPTGSPNDDFWHFFGNAGDVITLIVNRLEPDLDPALRLYFGTGTDTTALLLVATADDNYPELPGFAGPFADPSFGDVIGNNDPIFTIQFTGDYTVHVWDFISNSPQQVDRCYQITLNGEPTTDLRTDPSGCRNSVPEPTSLALLGICLAGLGIGRRHKRLA